MIFPFYGDIVAMRIQQIRRVSDILLKSFLFFVEGENETRFFGLINLNLRHVVNLMGMGILF